jgi:hypothetical protein
MAEMMAEVTDPNGERKTFRASGSKGGPLPAVWARTIPVGASSRNVSRQQLPRKNSPA